MKLYRIYTEDKGKVPEQLARQYLDAFTVYSGFGFWKGNDETCLVIEVLDNSPLGPIGHKVIALAKRIKEMNEQEAVFVACQNVELEII